MDMFQFSLRKTMQAAAVLLKQEPSKRMSRLRLIKLLVIADRERLRRSGRVITGDRLVAMEHGPVLSRTYDLIKGEDFDARRWERHFGSDGRDVVLHDDPGIGGLSRHEIAILHEISSCYREYDDYSIAIETHSYSEWLKNRPEGKTSKPIPFDDFLEGVGRLGDKQAIAEAAEAESAMDRALASV